MSCTNCLSNNDIQTPEQVSVPFSTPYFHKDTLTLPCSSRSPPLEGGGPSTFVARDTYYTYITHALYFEIYPTFLEVIQLISIAGYEAYVCVCFLRYVQPSYGCSGMPVVCLYCVKKLFNTLNFITKITGTRTKNNLKHEQGCCYKKEQIQEE